MCAMSVSSFFINVHFFSHFGGLKAMNNDWKSMLKADLLDWLLEPENPSVRFFTLRDLLDHPPNDPMVVEAKPSIRGWEKVSKILGKQKQEGYWESPEDPYNPKYKATYWQIMILGMLGLDKSDERVRKACDYIFRFQHQDGGFTSLKEEGARNEYEYVRRRMLNRGREPPSFEVWAPEAVREGEMSCLTGNICAALIRLGYADDRRVHKALDWLVEVQNVDGGWLCPYWKAHARDRHGCFMGTITPLDAFSQLPAEGRSPEVVEAVERGVEFLLMHRLFRADHQGFGVINESWLRFGFPRFSYDVLRGLRVVAGLGYGGDDRLDDALGVLLEKQMEDGRWVLENTPSMMQTNLEQKGKPSKWVTLDALRVIKKVHNARAQSKA